jgi:hypothetical protein
MTQFTVLHKNSERELWLTHSFHATEVTQLPSPDESHNLVAPLVQADQTYGQPPNPTLNTSQWWVNKTEAEAISKIGGIHHL